MSFADPVLLAVGLVVCFCLPLRDLIDFSLHNELYSHILLVPAVCAYFAWQKRREWAAEAAPIVLTKN